MKGIFQITINKNGSVDYNYKIALPASFLNMMTDMKDNPIEDLKKDAQQKGFEVVPYRDGNLMGIEAKKHLAFITDMKNEDIIKSMTPSAQNGGQGQSTQGSSGTPGGQGSGSQQNPQIVREQGILFDTYRMKANVDLSALNIPDSVKKFAGANGDSLSKSLYEQIDLRFLLTLPIQAKESNATQVIGSDGKTYEWDLVPGKNNPLMLAIVLPNLLHWLYVIGGVFLLFLIFLVRRRKRRKQSRT